MDPIRTFRDAGGGGGVPGLGDQRDPQSAPYAGLALSVELAAAVLLLASTAFIVMSMG